MSRRRYDATVTLINITHDVKFPAGCYQYQSHQSSPLEVSSGIQGISPVRSVLVPIVLYISTYKSVLVSRVQVISPRGQY